jgi:hypothetical protein
MVGTFTTETTPYSTPLMETLTVRTFRELLEVAVEMAPEWQVSHGT